MTNKPHPDDIPPEPIPPWAGPRMTPGGPMSALQAYLSRADAGLPEQATRAGREGCPDFPDPQALARAAPGQAWHAPCRSKPGPEKLDE